MSTEQGKEQAPGQRLRFTRRMCKAVERLQQAAGTERGAAAERVAARALSGDCENFYRSRHARLRARRKAAKCARLARRVAGRRPRRPWLSGGGGARPRPDPRSKSGPTSGLKRR